LNALIAFVRFVDGLNERVGRVVGWFTLGTVAVCALVVVLRYAVGVGFIWMQELYVWIHATVFMVGAGYTFKLNGHVRVDILYAGRSVRGKAWIDLFGGLVFLLPWLIVTGTMAAPWVWASILTNETSASTGGMPGLFVLKSVILIFCVLLGLQGLATMARSILVLNGREEWAFGKESAQAAV
jgi:TRAP-type mannitol/chloroaromatic compound transport system permease small subunit